MLLRALRYFFIFRLIFLVFFISIVEYYTYLEKVEMAKSMEK